MCVAGTCHPLPKNAVSVVLDGNVGHQVLVGFGATLVYAEGAVLEHPRKAALFEAMFSGLGLDILRLRNRYGYMGEDDLTTAQQLVDAATENLGRAPTVMLESWSPPSSFKANGATVCQGNADSCTLVQAEDGSFDYAGYAGYWRSALEAYADAGLEPDFIGIQNNPDFVPTALAPGEGCRFLPTEGTATALVDGSPVEVAYPGYAEALAAVVDELERLDTPPKIVAPDLSTTIGFADYVAELDLESVAALSHHLYGTDPVNVDLDALGAMRELGQSENLPLLQTEMEADGLGTAVLMHYGLVVEGISAYVQSVLVRPASVSPANIGTLITLEPDDFALQEPYFALGHYARHTDPGWVRVAAASASEELLASAWLSPERDALTVVMVNPTTSDVDAELDLGDFGTMSAQVTRTVFGGLEHAADLGGLSAEGILRVPAQAIVTVALRE